LPPAFDRRSAARSKQVPWRERPRDLTGVPITPAATDRGRSRHAVCAPSRGRSGVHRPEGAGLSRSIPARFGHLFAVKMHAENGDSFSAVAFHCAVRVDAPKALRFAPPALRAAIGLDRASRESRIAIIDGPRRGFDRPAERLLTTRGDGATLEVSSTAATRSFLHIARCEANDSAASGHDAFLLLDSSWSSVREPKARVATLTKVLWCTL
jgi:hypothetical protein